jgi:pimeloyl-ACP methyl ester carboxylesterase
MGPINSDLIIQGEPEPAGPEVLDHQRRCLLRRYVGAVGQQVHLTEGGRSDAAPTLCCLHATAYSARSLLPFLEVMADRRRVLAIDTPGYGGSDRPDHRLTIQDYALCIEAALSAAGEGRIDLFGYHTGALIAAELARARPERVARLVLIGVPFVTGVEQAQWRQRLATPMTLTGDLAQFQERWDFLVADRPAGMSLERGFDNFVDELRAYPYGWWAHDAAFTFDVARCLAEVEQPTLIINPANHLSSPSRRAAAALRNGQLLELEHLDNAIFDVAAEELAEATDSFLKSARP